MKTLALAALVFGCLAAKSYAVQDRYGTNFNVFRSSCTGSNETDTLVVRTSGTTNVVDHITVNNARSGAAMWIGDGRTSTATASNVRLIDLSANDTKMWQGIIFTSGVVYTTIGSADVCIFYNGLH